MRFAIRCLLWVVTAMGFSHTACAAPADLDPSFGEGGVARIEDTNSLEGGALLPDGGMAVLVDRYMSPGRVLRLNPDGRLDETFSVIHAHNDRPFGWPSIRAVATDNVGRIFTLHLVDWFPGCDLWVERHLASGEVDPHYGNQGRSVDLGGLRCGTGNLGVNELGEVFFPRSTSSIFAFSEAVVRVDAAGGQRDLLGGMGGLYVIPPWGYGRIALQPDGKVLAAMSSNEGQHGLTVMRLAGAVPDPGFGTNGLATANTLERSFAWDVAPAPDGNVVVAGLGNLLGRAQLVVARFTPDGRVDMSFGDGGIAFIQAAREDESVISTRVAVQPDGRIILAGTIEKLDAAGKPFPRVVVARLTSQGQPDLSFAPAGIADFWWERGTGLSFLLLRPHGRIVVGVGIWKDYADIRPMSQAGVFQLQGGSGSTERPLRERKAIEYFHAGYGHYFLTADPEEIVSLDVSPASGWVRTGREITVWDDEDVSLAPMCRFWSDQTWAPKSSHFYTPLDAECASVKGQPEWTFERNAFKVKLPNGEPGARMCPAGSQALYRAYNNGMTGAPNHRYMTDPALLDEMIARGWTMEGEAQTRIFACVPVQ